MMKQNKHNRKNTTHNRFGWFDRDTRHNPHGGNERATWIVCAYCIVTETQKTAKSTYVFWNNRVKEIWLLCLHGQIVVGDLLLLLLLLVTLVLIRWRCAVAVRLLLLLLRCCRRCHRIRIVAGGDGRENRRNVRFGKQAITSDRTSGRVYNWQRLPWTDCESERLEIFVVVRVREEFPRVEFKFHYIG